MRQAAWTPSPGVPDLWPLPGPDLQEASVRGKAPQGTGAVGELARVGQHQGGLPQSLGTVPAVPCWDQLARTIF